MPQGNAEGGQGQPMPPAPPLAGPAHSHKSWFAIIGALVVAIALLAGVDLARSNSDIICTRAFQDSGSCTSGSWGSWSLVSQSVDQNACRATYNETRIYTGLRNTISSTISVRANLHTHCNLSDDAFRGGSGAITSQFSACQIQESRTRVVAGTGAGTSCQVPSGASTNQGQITTDTNTETEGAVDNAKTTTVNGSYQLYLDTIDARLATSTFAAVPSLVHSGATTHIVWTSSHVKSCVVTGSNGDFWPKPLTSTQTVTDADGNQQQQQVTTTPDGKNGDELSAAITGQTTYTLVCTTATGTKLTSRVIVNLIPAFNER